MQLVTWLPVVGAGGTFSGRCDATQWSRGVESWGQSGVFNYKLWHGGATAQNSKLGGKDGERVGTVCRLSHQL